MEGVVDNCISVYDSNFLSGVTLFQTFKSSGKLRFGICSNSATFKLLKCLFEAFLNAPCGRWDYSRDGIITSFQNERSTYCFCVENVDDTSKHCHDAVPIMLGSNTEYRLLEKVFGALLEKRRDGKMSSPGSLLDVYLKSERETIERNVFSGCFIIKGVINHGLFRETNNNKMCYSAIVDNNIVVFLYDRLTGKCNKIFTRYTKGLYENNLEDPLVYSSSLDGLKAGDESKCVFGVVYLRDQNGLVTPLTRDSFEKEIFNKCIREEQPRDIFESDYSVFIEDYLDYMISSSTNIVEIDSIKNKVYMSFPEAVYNIMDKLDIFLFDESFWTKYIHRGDVVNMGISKRLQGFDANVKKTQERSVIKTNANTKNMQSQNVDLNSLPPSAFKTNFNTMFTTISYNVDLIPYFINSSCQRMSNKSRTCKTIRQLSKDSIGFICNLHVGNIVNSGKKIMLTERCYVSRGFNNDTISSVLFKIDNVLSSCVDSPPYCLAIEFVFLTDHKLLKRRCFVRVKDLEECVYKTWFYDNILIPIKRLLNFCEVNIFPSVSKPGRYFVTFSNTNGVLFLKHDYDTISRMLVGDTFEFSKTRIDGNVDIFLSRRELEQFSNIGMRGLKFNYFVTERPKGWQVGDETDKHIPLEIKCIDTLREESFELNKVIVESTNTLLLSLYETYLKTFPKARLAGHIFRYIETNDEIKQATATCCYKNSINSVKYLNASRLLNRQISFFSSPETVYRRDLTEEENFIDYHQRRSFVEKRPDLRFSNDNFIALNTAFGNVAGLNVEDAIIIHKHLDLDIHVLISAFVRFKVVRDIGESDEEDVIVSLPEYIQGVRGIPTMAFNPSDPEFDRFQKRYARKCLVVLSRDTETGKPTSVSFPICTIETRHPSTNIIFEPFGKYLVDVYRSTNGSKRYSAFLVRNDTFILDLVYRMETENVCGKLYVLGHNVKSADSKYIISFETVCRIPYFEGMKIGNEWAEKGLCVIRDLNEDFDGVDKRLVPSIIFNITSIQSRFTLGQILCMENNSKTFVYLKNGERCLTGYTHAFIMGPYIRVFTAPVRFDLAYQTALMSNGQSLALCYKKNETVNINPSTVNRNPIQPSVGHSLKLYEMFGVSMLFTDKSGKRRIRLPKWITEDDCKRITSLSLDVDDIIKGLYELSGKETSKGRGNTDTSEESRTTGGNVYCDRDDDPSMECEAEEPCTALDYSYPEPVSPIPSSHLVMEDDYNDFVTEKRVE